MALPVIRAIAEKENDITLTGLPFYGDLLPALGLDWQFAPLPKKGWRYYPHFLGQRGRYQRAVLFANSQRSDLEVWLAGIVARYGIAWPERPRRLLNHRFEITHPENDGERHQTRLWADFTAHFALQDGVDFQPLAVTYPRQNDIVLICGSQNSPEKRWPVSAWRELVQALLEKNMGRVLLTGTDSDRDMTTAVAQDFSEDRVINQAGKTGMTAFVQCLGQAKLVIGNDTGGLHLANAMGTPVIGLYGPTNPLRTGPVFDVPLTIIQPPDCPKQGGGEIAAITSETVIAAAQTMMGV